MEATRGGSRIVFACAGIALVAATMAIGWGVGQYRMARRPALPPTVEPLASKRGALLYQTACANCHGPDGAGDGVSAVSLQPPPRDFAVRPWRFEPTKASIRRVILQGIPGTAMPANLGIGSDSDINALVEHVYSLATARPSVIHELSPDASLLKTAGFVDLQGSAPPPLAVTDSTGRVKSLADFRGKLVIVSFWGTTCIHCFKEMPHLRTLEMEYAKRGLTVMHVCADADDTAQAQALLDKHAPGIQGYTDETGLGLARFEVQTLPTVWLIGADGRSIGRSSGAVDWQSAEVLALIHRWLPTGKN